VPRREGSVTGQVEIAKAAGVSAATVSNTINKPHLVTASTRKKVLTAMRRLDFVPNEAAASLRRGTNRMLGLVVPDITNPFYAAIAEGVTSEADRRGYSVVLCNSRDDPAHELNQLQMLGQLRTAGALVVPVTADYSRLNRLRELGVRLILIDRKAALSDGCSASIDDVLGGRMAVGHLLELKGPDLVLLNGPESIAQCHDRREGARAAYADAGLDPQRLRELRVPNMDVQQGRQAVTRLLEDDALPQSIFATNDLLAWGAISKLMAAGLQIPGDIAVVGYGDLAIAENLPVPLTTIEQPKTELGRAAVEMILAEIDQNENLHRHSTREFQPRLIVRESAPRMHERI
jgi:LacI family transcriptional regulator